MATKNYRITLKAEGPIHIGNGKQYGKKDYFLHNGAITILDMVKFVSLLNAEQLKNYCEFLEKDSQRGLQDFLSERKLSDVATKAKLYQVDINLSRARRGSYQYLDVFEFMKDAYGCPYVPGSSLKGMLRTMILTSIILADQVTYEGLFDRQAVRNKNNQKRAGKAIEKNALWIEKPDPTDPAVINDIMRYVSVSDSEPLSVSDLVFVKKYDKFAKTDDGRHKREMGTLSDNTYYQGNELNIYRECLKPGTKIEFTLGIDERINKYLSLDTPQLLAMLQQSMDLYKKCFLDHFDETGSQKDQIASSSSSDGRCKYIVQSGPLAGSRCRNSMIGDSGYCRIHQDAAEQDKLMGNTGSTNNLICYLGGGTDFNTKTIVNALFKNDFHRLDEISRILYSQFPTKIDASIYGGLETDVRDADFVPIGMPAKRRKDGKLIRGKEDHRHWRDFDLGVSPHTLKLGKIGSTLYPMGKCRIRIEENK